MDKIRRFLCAVIGHNFIIVTRITTERSQYGHMKCQRCGIEEAYQYDM